jgi:hypothetical protein
MKSTPAILPKNMKILKNLGEHILLARLRRKLLSARDLAEKLFIISNKAALRSPLGAICKYSLC